MSRVMRLIGSGGVGLGLVLSFAATSGCASSKGPATEGAYVNPAGFQTAQTELVTMAPLVFSRSGAQVLTRTVLARQSARKAANLDPMSSVVDRRERHQVEATFLGTYADGVRVSVSARPQAYVDVVPVGGQAGEANVRSDGAVVSFEGAFPNVTSAWGAKRDKLEEFLVVQRPEETPTLQYKLVAGPDFDPNGWTQSKSGTLYARALDNTNLFAIHAPTVQDAQGTSRTGEWTLSTESNTQLLTAKFDLSGLVYPLLLDPSFDTPEWTPVGGSTPNGREGAASTFYDSSASGIHCSVFSHGETESASLQDTAVYCGSSWASLGGAPFSGAPSARSFPAMAFAFPGTANEGAYFFGGVDDDGVPANDLYQLTLSSGGTTGTWTQIQASGATSGPSARYLHGVAWTGSSLLVWGGVDTEGNLLQDQWTWTPGGGWTELSAQFPASNVTLYGFTPIQAGTLASPTIYSFGGYTAEDTSGTFTNTLYQFTGSAWTPVSIKNAFLPTINDPNQNGDVGVVNTPAMGGISVAPGRYLSLAAQDGNGNLLIATGTNATDSSNTTTHELSDAWIIGPLSPSTSTRWFREPVEDQSVGDADPGWREAGSAVYDSTNQQIVILGGADACADPTAETSCTTDAHPITFTAPFDSVSMEEDCLAPSPTNPNVCGTFTLTATVLDPTGAPLTTAQGFFIGKTSAGYQIANADCGSASDPLGNTSGVGTGVITCTFSPPAGTTFTAFIAEVRDGNLFDSDNGDVGLGNCSPDSSGPYCDPANTYNGTEDSCQVPTPTNTTRLCN